MNSFLILLILAAASSMEATLRYSCIYKDKLFTESDDVYSFHITRQLNFQSHRAFWYFYNKVDAIMKDETKDRLYNTLDPFLAMLDEYKSSNGSFKDFFHEYVPAYPPVSKHDDSIPALMRVYEKLIEVDDRVKSAFVLAAKAKGVTEQFARNLSKKNMKYPCEVPPAEFQPEELVGIIRILIQGKHEGVILLDVNNPKPPTPVVMANSTLSFNINHEIEGSYKIDYTYSPDYITINSYKFGDIPQKFSSIPDKYFEMERRDLLYTARSLCDFLKTSVKKSLLNPTRRIEKFTPEGEIEGFVKVDVINENVEMYSSRFKESQQHQKNKLREIKIPPFSKGFEIFVNIDHLNKETFVGEVLRYLLDIQSHFNMKESELKDKLTQFHKAVNTGDVKRAFKQLIEETKPFQFKSGRCF